jgi:hypothetical protein
MASLASGRQAGMGIAAGVDNVKPDATPSSPSIEAMFLPADAGSITGAMLDHAWAPRQDRFPVGCAPFQPVSTYLRG